MELSKFTFTCLLLLLPAAVYSAAPPACQRDSRPFRHDLNSYCPFSITVPISPIQVNEELLERAVSSIRKNEYAAILFYASWCPFSSIFQSKLSTLSSMYPQIQHLMVEQSSVMPSIFSRYGIHSVPSLLIVNQTNQIRYFGRKDLSSLLNFYKRATRMDPVADIVEEMSSNPSFTETLLKEPYLVLSFIFVSLRAFLYFFPKITSWLSALWIAYIPRLNVGIFGESRQILGRVLHLIDVRRIWSKLRLSKARNFHQGARNARVWASSLASVSLGETSSSRVFPPRDL